MQLDGQTLPKIWIYICKGWLFVAVGALVMPLVVWIMLISENLNTYRKTMHLYLGNSMEVYDQFSPPDASGYVNETNIPKHLGGAVFAAAFDVAMIILTLLSLAAEVFWKFPIAKQILVMLWTPGLWNEDAMDSIEYFFLIANAFLKIFIVAATGAQTYTGLQPSAASGTDGPLFCLYATMILLGSIPLTIIAQMFVLQSAKKAAWGGIRGAQDEEMKAGAKAEGVKEGKAAAAKAAAAKAKESK